MTDHTDKPKRCVVCDGKGYINCGCWPGDCICGWGDEDCEECDGTGFIWPDDEWECWDDYEVPT